MLLSLCVSYTILPQVVALGNIAKRSQVLRDLVLQEGAIDYLVQQLSTQAVDLSNQSMLRSATRTLSILCRGKRHPNLQHEHLALQTLAQLIRSGDEEVGYHKTTSDNLGGCC